MILLTLMTLLFGLRDVHQRHPHWAWMLPGVLWILHRILDCTVEWLAGFCVGGWMMRSGDTTHHLCVLLLFACSLCSMLTRYQQTTVRLGRGFLWACLLGLAYILQLSTAAALRTLRTHRAVAVCLYGVPNLFVGLYVVYTVVSLTPAHVLRPVVWWMYSTVGPALLVYQCIGLMLLSPSV